jgi:2-iminobutanoate/2-iminopropanoate deaminase
MSRPVGPYSPARRAGDWVICSGQVGVAPGPDGVPALVPGGTVAELGQALSNLATVLATEGASVANVVRAGLYLVDMGEFAEVNARWVEFFDEPRPARSAIGVAALPLGARVEVDAWAWAPLA